VGTSTWGACRDYRDVGQARQEALAGSGALPVAAGGSVSSSRRRLLSFWTAWQMTASAGSCRRRCLMQLSRRLLRQLRLRSRRWRLHHQMLGLHAWRALPLLMPPQLQQCLLPGLLPLVQQLGPQQAGSTTAGRAATRRGEGSEALAADAN
jgi:hypothetical protein